ncbi:hypothetical protein ACTA71_006278 [Dictyostelium dimigraforme]
MKIIQLLFVLVCLIGAISSQTIFKFNFNPLYCGAQDNACRFLDANNWDNGIPTNGSSVVIDFTEVTNSKEQVFILASGVNNTFINMTITGSATTNVVVSFFDTNIEISQNFTGNNNASIVFDNQKSNNVTLWGYDFEVGGKFLIQSSTVESSYSILKFNNMFVDQNSKFSVQNTNVLINGLAQFWTTVSLTDESSFIANECVFNAGINSDSRVTLGPTSFFSQSNLEIVTFNDDVSIEGGALTISDSFKFTGNPTITVHNSNFTISGSSSATFPSIVLESGNLVCFHPTGNFSNGVQGNGTITFDINKQGVTQSQCDLWNVNSTAINVVAAGDLVLNIQNSKFGSLSDKQSSFVINPDHAPTPSIQFFGVNKLDYIFTNLSQIVFNDESFISLNGPTDSWVKKLPINLLGNLAINQVNLFATVHTMDQASYLGLNGGIIGGSVSLTTGRFHAEDIATITGDFILAGGALLDLDQTSSQFSINGNFEMDSESSVFIAESLSTTSLVIVGGNLVLNGTLIMDVSDTNPSDGDSFNLIQCDGNTVGSFSTVTLLSNGLAYTSMDYSLSYKNNVVSISFSSKEPSHKKLPGWAVFLIILAVLVVVAGAAYGYIRYKKRAGYLPIN